MKTKSRYLFAFVAIAATMLVANTTFAQRCQGGGFYDPVYIQPPIQQPIYSQPIYSQPVYSQPIYSQPVAKPQPKKPSPLQVARNYTARAKKQFLNQRYEQAVVSLNEVVKNAAKDPNAYQFRALAEFARGEYDSAAADIYDAMSLGNSWTKDTVNVLYGEKMELYQAHVNQLKASLGESQNMQKHFLLAYHYIIDSDWKSCKFQLEQVLALKPQEPLASKLLTVINQQIQTAQK